MNEQSSDERDYFSDPTVARDPYAYFAEMYAKSPVHQLKTHDVVLVTGYKEALEVLQKTDDFSSINSVPGAAFKMPFEPVGDDISAQIAAHRPEILGGNLLVTYDGPPHSASRSLLTGLFVPSRLKANAEYMSTLADTMVREAVAKGKCDIIDDIATPYATLVIADLLGVPEADRELFRRAIDAAPPPGNMNDGERPTQVSPLEYMAGFFVRYIQERRISPRNDVLTELANAKYPDGSVPDLMELVTLSTFLFGAGQDTSAKLLANAMRQLVDTPGLQQRLRNDRSLIPAFIEEVLRLEGSSKITSRLARKNTKIGDMEIPAGKSVLISLAAANRDPRRWEAPTELRLDRPKIKEHLAFGRGAHVCIGAPLARAEVRTVIEKFLEHTSSIGLSPEHHGTPGDRHLDYEPSFIIRGLAHLYVELEANSTQQTGTGV
jgi:cytochrome P450